LLSTDLQFSGTVHFLCKLTYVGCFPFKAHPTHHILNVLSIRRQPRLIQVATALLDFADDEINRVTTGVQSGVVLEVETELAFVGMREPYGQNIGVGPTRLRTVILMHDEIGHREITVKAKIPGSQKLITVHHAMRIGHARLFSNLNGLWGKALPRPHITLATAFIRRSAATVPQLNASVPRKATQPFANPDIEAGSSAYCNQLTNA